MFQGEEEGVLYFMAEGSSTLDDDVYAYYMSLENAGYEFISEEGDIVGGILCAKAVTVNDEECVLAVEFLNYEGFFAILFYITY